MKYLMFTLSLALGLSAAEIPQGTHVLLRMVNSVSTRTAKEGDRIYLRTASPILINGQMLVPVDSYVEGSVSRSMRSGRIKGRAELGVRIETILLPGGKNIRVSPKLASVDADGTGQKVEGGENAVKQGGTREQDVVQTARLAGAGAAIGGIADRSWTGAGIGAGAGTAAGLATALLTRGKEVELRQGSTFDVVFDRAVTVE